MRPRPVFAVLGVIVLGLFIWAASLDFDLLLFGFLVILAVYVLIVIPWHAKKTYRNYKALSLPVTVEVLDEGLRFESPTGNNLAPWDHFVKWRKNKNLILVYPTKRLFHLLPRHFFETSADFDRIRRCKI